MDILSAVNASIIIGSMSHHITDEFEPVNKYNENHRSIGVELVEKGTGWTQGASGFKFRDSYNKASHSVLYSLGWTKEFSKEVNVRCGGSVGYISTSYYSGAGVLPFCSGSYKRIGLDVSFLPKIENADAVLMFQAKWRLN